MKIWSSDPSAITPVTGPVDIGAYLSAGEAPQPGAAVCVGADFQEGSETDVAAWIVPAGLAADVDLLRRVLATGKDVMVALNGIGPKTYQALVAVDPNRPFINLFDARDQDAISYLEQLVWLAGRGGPFAVMARSPEKLVQAAALGAAHLIVPGAGALDITSIHRMAAAGASDAARPTSPAEVDHLVGGEASLTVTAPMAAGAILRAADLATAVTAERGLSPSLRDSIVGRQLRYAIEPGEPLNFGHLEPVEQS
jgi:hypothetical protein